MMDTGAFVMKWHIKERRERERERGERGADFSQDAPHVSREREKEGTRGRERKIIPLFFNLPPLSTTSINFFFVVVVVGTVKLG